MALSISAQLKISQQYMALPCIYRVFKFCIRLFAFLFAFNTYIFQNTGPKTRMNSPETWGRDDQSKYELTKLSTSWPNSEDELTKWKRIDQIDENELT